MKESLLFLFIGIGLSMDAFSLAVVYGTNDLEKKKCLILSIIVGVFHFIMPNLGSILSNKLLTNFATYGNIITGIVFLVLGIQMILSLNDEEKTTDLSNYLEIIMFAIAVSIDSFTVGMALSLEKQNIILGGIIFSLVSSIFTLTGLFLGKYLSKYGKVSKIIGIIILFIFSINIYCFKVRRIHMNIKMYSSYLLTKKDIFSIISLASYQV